MNRLRVALVGCGIISELHLRALLQQRERCDIAACCDTDSEKARNAARLVAEERNNGAAPAALTDYAEILANPDIDAVVLCLPHHLHAPMTLAAVHTGRHVLCEKPLALTLADCDSMAGAAAEAGVVLYHGENMRTADIVEKAAEILRDGRVGAIVGVQATYAHWQNIALNRDWRTNKAESGGGHLIDGAIHWIDILRHLCGDISAVHAMTATFRPELGANVEDTGVLNFRFQAGHLGQLFACHASRGRGASPMLTVFGTEGCLTLEPFRGDAPMLLFRPQQEPEAFQAATGWQESFNSQAAHFLDVVLEGVPLRATPADARENLRVILAAYQSVNERREIAL